MKNLKQRGATLLELLTYLVLISLLLGSLAATEKTARRAVQQQVLMLRLHQDVEKISRVFRKDLLASFRQETQLSQENRLILVQPQKKIHYQINEKGELWRHLIPDGQITPTESLLISKKFSTHSFKIDPSGLVHFQFKLRSAFTDKNLGEIFGSFTLKVLPRLTKN